MRKYASLIALCYNPSMSKFQRIPAWEGNYETRKRIQEKLRKKEPLSPHEKIPEELASFLGRKFHHEIKVVDPKEIRGNLGLYDKKRTTIFLSRAIFESGKEGHEHTLFHELGHFLDRQIKTKTPLSLLDGEAVAELFYYLILAGGDVAAAERDARDDYKSKRSGWLFHYDYRGPKADPDNLHVHWEHARTRALELYNSPISQEICKLTNWLPPKETTSST